MHCTLQKLHGTFRNLASGEQGQDLIEYAMLTMLITLALISGVGGIAAMVSHTFSNISSSLA